MDKWRRRKRKVLVIFLSVYNCLLISGHVRWQRVQGTAVRGEAAPLSGRRPTALRGTFGRHTWSKLFHSYNA